MAAQNSVRARLDSASLVPPDAIFALTVLLDSLPPYDAEALTELFAAHSPAPVPRVNLLGVKTDPDRFLLELERGPSRAYVIVRNEPYARSAESELGPTLAHAGLWPGSTIPPRTLAKLQGERYLSPRSPDGEVQLISHIARRLLERHGVGLVANYADQALKPRDRALHELGRTERPEHLPFAAWIEPKIIEEDGARWWAAVGLEPLALPDIYVRIPRPELEGVARNSLFYACWYHTKDHAEGLVYLPDSFNLDEGSVPRLGESNSFVPHRKRPHEDPWRLYLEPTYSST